MTLASYVAAWASIGPGAAPAQLARHTAPYLVANMAVMPTDLCSAGGSASAYEMDLRDGHIMLRGRESEAASVVWGRLHQNLERFAVIGLLKGRLPNSGATKDILERLFMGVGLPSGPPLVRTAELARELERRGKGLVVRELLAAGSSVSQVVEEILESHSSTAGSSTVPHSGDASEAVVAAGSSGGGGGAMEQHEFDRAVTSPNFIEAYEKIKDVSGVEVLDAAATSGSILMLRYMFMSPAWMRPRHAAFDILGKNLADRQSYLAYCSAVDIDTEVVPPQLSTYRLSDAQNEAFWSFKWDELDMVNATSGSPNEGGFLALRYLQHGTTYAKVDAADFYTVESALAGIKEWFGRLLVGVGFSLEPGEGYSWAQVVERQLELVQYVNGLPASEITQWRAWASENFRMHALQRAQVLFRSKLVTSRPADETISAFLPDGSAFFANIAAKLEDAKPIAVVRRAFPSYFPSEPVVLAGTSGVKKGGGGGKDVTPEGGGSRYGGLKPVKGGGKKRDASQNAPGSRADLAKVLSSGHLFLAGKVCDVKAVASTLKVDVDALCWPVLFSTKKGEDALALCPCPDAHGGINSKWHRPPKGFDRDKLVKKFWTAASGDQLREAGWRNAKVSKT